jgi:hypothetical protein
MSDKHKITFADGGHIREELSAYIDGALGAAEHETVRVHMEGCALCRAEYEELSMTRNLLRSMPMIAPPRAFTLTEEMTAPVRRGGFWESLLSPRNGPRLATGSALSFALVVMLLVGNLLFIQKEENLFRLSEPMSASSAATHTSGTGDLQLGESPFESSTKRIENAQPPQAQGGPAASEVTPAADSIMSGALPDPMATNAPVAMPAPTATALASGGIGGAVSTSEAVGIIEATPSLADTDNDGAWAQVTATPVSLSASVLATATALSDALLNSGSRDATAEAAGRAAPQPARPGDTRPLYNEPTGNGQGFYVGLIALFLALGVLLGAGALVARRRRTL